VRWKTSIFDTKGWYHNFKIEITIIPASIPEGEKVSNINASKLSHCFLEQYYLLLDKGFNLNIQLIVNFRANQGKVYIYNKNKSVLLY
jgi:hypothetical protein